MYNTNVTELNAEAGDGNSDPRAQLHLRHAGPADD